MMPIGLGLGIPAIGTMVNGIDNFNLLMTVSIPLFSFGVISYGSSLVDEFRGKCQIEYIDKKRAKLDKGVESISDSFNYLMDSFENIYNK